MKKWNWLLLVLAFALVLGGCDTQAPNDTPDMEQEGAVVYFATDIHYLAPELLEGGSWVFDFLEQGDGKMPHYSREITAAFLDQVLEDRPAALVLGGDLTYNGEQLSHRELAEMLTPVKEAGIPVLVIPGNHDINNPYAFQYTESGAVAVDNIGPEEFWELYSPLGAIDAISFDTASMSYMYPLTGQLQLLMLDSCIYEERFADGGRIKAETLEWMEIRLKQAKQNGVSVTAVMHHNLLEHNPMFTSYTISNWQEVVELFEKYDVSLNLSGHMHIQHIQEWDGTYDIATNALTVFPNLYGSLMLYPDGEAFYMVGQVGVSAWAERQGLENEDLLGFVAYAREYFKDTSRLSLAAMLEEYDLTEEQKEQMVEFAIDVNTKYFMGAGVAVSPDDEVYLLWQEHCGDSFFTYYLNSIVAEGTQDSLVLYVSKD